MSILCCIPLYNPSIARVHHIISRVSCYDISILFIANSIVDFADDLRMLSGIYFIESDHNVGTSGAYNVAIRFIYSNSTFRFLLLLDQDSLPSFEYLEFCISRLYCSSFERNTIYAPLDAKAIACRSLFGTLPDEISGDYSFRSITDAKSSGLLIPRHVFDYLSFCESLYVDYVDWYFCWQARILKYSICEVLNISLDQHDLGNPYVVAFLNFEMRFPSKHRRKIQNLSAFHLILNPLKFTGAPFKRILSIFTRPFANSILNFFEYLGIIRPIQ